jgi:hypothetical protein
MQDLMAQQNEILR